MPHSPFDTAQGERTKEPFILSASKGERRSQTSPYIRAQYLAGGSVEAQLRSKGDPTMTVHRRYVIAGAVAAGFLGVVLSGGAFAQEIPCTEEIRTFCAEVQPGGGRILQCLKANEAKLSLACTKRVGELEGAVSGPLGACRDDWAALCYHPRALTGRQEMIHCLQAHQAKLSTGCQKALQSTGGKGQRSRGVTQ
jgi:hypothetical protein